MSLHYNAFISYKHAELDNKIAAEIEKSLERYHIPKKIQKKTGIKKIERIFRDKDELPITSDLTDTINEALLNSDYLIVLCSKSTCLSTWVEREIKLFLQTHPLDHVLTVLAEGEPYEVIPKILLSREVQRPNYMGQMEAVIEPVEPLSCDYRLPIKEARNTELPRLAAALIGCSYNELMNRQRQYKMKRLTAVAAGVVGLSLGFGGYMLYSNQKINENYQQSLMNQSRFLANESEQLLEEEQRIEALQLALAALPNEEYPDRPVIPEAVRALNKASLAYVTQTGSNITAVWNYTMPDVIKKFKFSENGSNFAALDKSHNVKAWDCKERELIFQYSSNSEIAENIMYLSDEELLIMGDHFLKAVDVHTGSIMWAVDIFGEEESVSIYGDPTVLDDGTFLLGTLSDGIYRISSKDGSIVDNYLLPTNSEWYRSADISMFSVSPDQKKLIIVADMGEEEDRSIVMYDMASKTYSELDLITEGYYDSQNDYVDCVSWIDDQAFCFAIHRNVYQASYRFLDMEALSDSHADIYVYNAEDLTLKWQYDFVYNAVAYKSNFATLPGTDSLIYYSGNVCQEWDKNTGEVLGVYDINESIIAASISRTDGTYSLITKNGSMARPNRNRENNYVAVMSYFADGLSDVVFNNGVYANCDGSREIIYYGIDVFDDNFQKYTGSPDYSSVRDFLIDEDALAVLDYDDKDTFIDFFNLTSEKYMGRYVLDSKDNSFEYELIGMENETAYVVNKSDGFTLVEVNVRSLEAKETKIYDGYFSSTKGTPVVKAGKLIYYDGNQYDNQVAVCYDLASGDKKEFKVEQEYDGFTAQFCYSPETNLIYYAGKYDYILNVETGEAIDIAQSAGWNGTRCVYIDPVKEVILTSDYSEILINDFDGEVLGSIVCPELDVFGFTIYTPEDSNEKSQVLVMYSDGFLYRYDLETGEYIAQSELTYASGTKSVTFDFDTEKGLLYVTGGKVLDIIDIDSWVELTYITSALGYYEETDSFVVYSYGDSSEINIGFYKQYTLEELIQRANDMIEGAEMSEDFKAKYGIG